MSNTVTCPSCAGRKTIHNTSTHDDSPCPRCGGRGVVDKEEAGFEALGRRLHVAAHAALDRGDMELASLLSDTVKAMSVLAGKAGY